MECLLQAKPSGAPAKAYMPINERIESVSMLVPERQQAYGIHLPINELGCSSHNRRNIEQIQAGRAGRRANPEMN